MFNWKKIMVLGAVVASLFVTSIPAQAAEFEEADYLKITSYKETMKPTESMDGILSIAVEGEVGEDGYLYIIESVKVNGSALTVTGKAVDITVPTDDQIKALAATEIGRLIDVAGDDEVLKDIGALVDYVEDNAADIAKLVTDVNTANTNASNAVTTSSMESSVAAASSSIVASLPSS